jgi:RNA polymerase sigma-70 factor (ECF subfamily)
MVPNKKADSDQNGVDVQLAVGELVQKAIAGDRLAFHRLVDQFQMEIYRMIYYRTRSKMDAEDLTQDVFTKAFKHIGRLKAPEVFRSWLYRIAVNRVRDYYRRKKYQSLFGWIAIDDEGFNASEEMAVGPEAEEGVSRQDFWRQVTQMLNSLPRMEREVFTLRFLDQLTILEISKILKKNESTVKTHLYRALKKVKTMAVDLALVWEDVT